MYDKKKGHKKEFCNSCYIVLYRRKLKKKCIEYKGGKCIRCGYCKCDSALAFHHINPEDKSFAIASGGYVKKWETLKQELDKCILVCQNCHNEIHEEIDKNLIPLQVISYDDQKAKKG